MFTSTEKNGYNKCFKSKEGKIKETGQWTHFAIFTYASTELYRKLNNLCDEVTAHDVVDVCSFCSCEVGNNP
jgi:hypothetical protein